MQLEPREEISNNERRDDWVTLHKPKGRFAASVSVIAVTRKETVRTPKDPDRCLGFGTIELG